MTPEKAAEPADIKFMANAEFVPWPRSAFDEALSSA